MFEKEKVEEIIALTKRERWPYPVIFNMLKEAGVTHYETQVGRYEIVYSGEGGQLEERGPKEFKAAPAERFDAEAVKKAIRRSQKGQTDYPQFLREIAAAGVHTYRVEMDARTVTYRGAQGEAHIEAVPQP